VTTRWRGWLAGGAAVAWAAAAHAHAFLDHARPPVGGTVGAPPAAVQLWFTERLEPAFSTLQVLAPSGERVDQGGAQVGPDGTRLSVALKPLPPGRYKVVWRVVSVDTHVTNGEFSFEVTR
jgi:copper resistance protein C